MNVLKWMEEIQFIEGYLRACLYDLPRSKFSLVDKNTIELIDKIDGHSLELILKKLNSTEIEWLEEFINKEFIFEVPKSTHSNFKSLNLNWESPEVYNNAYIDSIKNIDEIINMLTITRCKHVLINFIDFYEAKKVLKDHFSETCFWSVNINIEKLELEKKYDELKELFPVINNISFGYDTKNELSEKKIELSNSLKPSFIVNLQVFTESIEHNVYYNKKVFVMDGNTYATKTKNNRLNSINIVPDIWKSNKDNMDICCDCEFRRMCVDSRQPLRRSLDKKWYNTIECQYNPYIAKWSSEDGYKTLLECGVVSNEHGFSLDHDLISNINNEIWCEE